MHILSQTPVIEYIIEASKLLKNSKLEDNKVTQAPAIIYLNQYFSTETIETIILVAVFQLSARGNSVDRNDLSKFFDCNPIVLLRYETIFTSLLNKGHLQTAAHFRSRRADRWGEYHISDSLYAYIVDNKPLGADFFKKKTDAFDIILEVGEMIESREDSRGETLSLIDKFKDFLENYNQNSLCVAIAEMRLTIMEKLWFSSLTELNVRGRFEVELDRLGYAVFNRTADRLKFYTSLQNGSNDLISKNWISFSSGGHFSEARIRLTKKSQIFLKPLGIDIVLNEVEKDLELIPPNSIVRKKLFYNTQENKQVATILNSLKYRNHGKIVKQLEAQGVRTGICTLLYGAPGTGKTESVYQIARETGRPLWKVDLTELKSMWFGESQKKVKALFETYKKVCQNQKRIPILLLNEADAILGTRNTNVEGAAQSADNAIQNIFLDCLENFEGILFATTNLEKSLDAAFERRFLFKVEFNRPQAEAQQQIWKSKLRELKPDQAKQLSEQFDLSGGEIENVLRKLSMQRILLEEIEVYETLLELCATEKMGLKKVATPIGFK